MRSKHWRRRNGIDPKEVLDMYVQKALLPTVPKKFVQISFRGKVIDSNQAFSNLIHDVN